ncbi:hypothetical protein ACFXKC_57750 [Streptomyces sp. NPDC059340]|uniref:hypothetical protein n=1 Tax=Streptomyces sp. NPDC059340 TaxID=3346806 RepID=UPI0036823921
MTDPQSPRPAATGKGLGGFPLLRWVLAPRTTWQARRIAADFGPGMDTQTAWTMARLQLCPDERPWAMTHLDSEHDS